MAWGVTAVAIGGALIGAYATSQASNRAADAQRDASKSSNATQLYMYDQTRSDNEPWRVAGQNALGRLQDPNLANTLSMDPGYQFRLDQGNKSINSSLAARGMGNSGAALKSLTRYGQDFASNEFGNAYNRLSSLAGLGQTANSSNQAAGANYANAVNANNAAIGNAAAANQIGQANNFNQLIGTGVNAYMGGYYRSQQPKIAPQMTLGSSANYSLPAGSGYQNWNQS